MRRFRRLEQVERRQRLARLFFIVMPMLLLLAPCAVTLERSICRFPPGLQAWDVAKSIQFYRLLHGDYPSTLDDLVTPPKGNPLFAELPRSACGAPLAYLRPGLRNTESFDVVSAGPDCVFFSADDEGNWPRP